MLDEGVILVPNKGDIPVSNLLYFQVSEELNGSEDNARFTEDRGARFNWVSEVELSLCIGDLGEVSICECGPGWPIPIPKGSTIDTGDWFLFGLQLLPHCRIESGADAFLVTF